MKKGFRAALLAAATLGIGAVAIVGVVSANRANAFKTDAVEAPVGCQSRSISSTQNINLQDTSEENVRAYYASLSSLDASERQGQNLLKNLKPILSNMYYYTYDAVWKIYEITDRDWDLSPASGTTYGTCSNDTITGYAYGSNKNNPYVHALYRNHEDPDSRIRAWDAHTGNNNNFLNREHVWCQSRGFKAKSGASGPAGTDVHHLIAGDGRVNTQEHNNYPYGNVDHVEQDASTIYSWLSGNVNGSAKRTSPLDQSSVVFEPQDCDKGDIARACFYMAARYNNLSGNDTITQFEPELTIADYATSAGASEISSETGSPVAIGILGDLLQWHQLDPVDEYEIHRNNLIYENYQMNRNPFIDFPEWVDYIWGKPQLDEDKRVIRNWSETPTGAADPANDIFHGYHEAGPEPEPVEAVDIIDKAFTGNPSNTYVSWSGKQGSVSNAVYAGRNAGGNGSVQLRTSDDESGIVSTTSGGKITNVTVSWNDNTSSGRKLEIYCKNTTYSGPSDLYDAEKQGTRVGEIAYGSTTSLAIDDDYEYIGIRSKSGALYLDSIAITYNGSNSPSEFTSITATTAKSFKVGQTIKATDIVVKGNDDSTITGFVFPDYQFTYLDAPSGGGSVTKQLPVIYNDLSTTLEVSVSRDAYQTTDIPVSISLGTSDWSDIEETTKDTATDQTIEKDGITYVSTESYRYNSYLSFKTTAVENSNPKKYKTESKFYNETAFEYPVKQVSFSLCGNVATVLPIVEYSDDLDNWSETNNYGSHHFRIGYAEGAEFTGFINIESITIELFGEGAMNLANYLMYEDTNNQCLTKLDVASDLFAAMSPLERSTFMTSSGYVISAARDRLEAWATGQGRSIVVSDGDYVIQSSVKTTAEPMKNRGTDNTVIIVAFIVAASFVSGGFYFYLSHKEE